MNDAATRLHDKMVYMVTNWERFQSLFDGNGRESLPIRLDRIEQLLQEKPWVEDYETFEDLWQEFLVSEAAKERNGAGRFERIVLALGVIASLYIQILGG